MDYQVILSRPAIRDLGEIARYVAKDNSPAAEKVGLQLLTMAESLNLFPRRGGALKSRSGVRRLVQSPYLVTYRIDEAAKVVYVLRFWHAKRDLQNWRSE